jgi:cyclic beta-1,2-glucan synthetase
MDRCRRLADRAAVLTGEMDFKMLYNEQRHLFAIGYNLAQGRLDNAHYDLLASEACLTSFLAIARGDVPRKHWFQLGRPLTQVRGSVALLSWGGTMFEYLMPRLLLHALPGTLLDESQHSAVTRQIEYGRQCRVPWGISESAYGAVDSALNYQYQAFGVPGLGLKRGLAKDLVIAPYAALLAASLTPRAVVQNLQALAREGGEGTYGFYEALDYSRDRLLPNRGCVVVKCFMAHHQGMSFVALANCLLDDPMRRRFHAEPMVRATELLLQERVPEAGPFVQPHQDESALPHASPSGLGLVSRRITTPHTAHPRTHLLSSGQYSVMVTNAGSGWSVGRGLDVTRWREDRTCDARGQFYYVRDLRSGQTWSAAYQPLRREAEEYEVVYSTDKAEFRRMEFGIETHLEVTVSPETHAEIRRLTLHNLTGRPRDLEVTSYAEVVLGPHGADLAHPAFGKLFLETEFVAGAGALLLRRRPRAAGEKPVWCLHVLAVDAPSGAGEVQYETDRARFLGRGRTPANPAALEPGTTLSGTTGPVLDPIFSLRQRVRVPAESFVILAFTTALAETRDEALALADHYHDFHGVTRAFELAWAHTQVELRHLRLTAPDAHLYQRLAAHVIYSGSALRAPAAVLAANTQGQAGLWRNGISGDNPIVLAVVSEPEHLPLVRQLFSAHAYWRLKGLTVDLVILNEHEVGYQEELHEQLQSLVRDSEDRGLLDKPGGVFVRKAPHLAREDQMLLQAAARCVLAGDRGSLAVQVDRFDRTAPAPALPAGSDGRKGGRAQQQEAAPRQPPAPAPDLRFANGLGGFTPDGREYVLEVQGGGSPRTPPAPWINAIANPSFGFLVSESGGGYTWAGNSQLNRLTPWQNDPVSDAPGEVVYLRDEATGDVWTPTPQPLGGVTPCTVRHGQGYTSFQRTGRGLGQELVLFAAPDDPVKIIRLRVRNLGQRSRRLSATFYAELVLGRTRDQAAPYVVTEVDPETGGLLARNSFNGEFAARIAFADVSLRPRSLTADRTEFLGRNGSTAAPAALLAGAGLSGAAGPALDPCAALQAPFELHPGEEKEVVFVLGEPGSVEEARRLLRRYREPGRVRATFDEVKGKWERLLTAVEVHTPDEALDLLVNRWLPYQVLSCRVWGRSALYQSGGAYGFRDQLQDVMALVYSAPAETRAQILRAATRQFREGDVQHWWHPESGAGVRTRISDDLLWLPFVVAHYVNTTGDTALLDEGVPFLEAPPLRPEQEEDYRSPKISEETASVYEHCLRAIDHGCRYGDRGLPLMGTGDWNDGMNRVGTGGKGESVWNAWFLLTVLRSFAGVAEVRGDGERARQFHDEADRLRSAVELQAWDGEWYRRAYFDDGTPLGSAQDDECRIDSLAQSWAVISGEANGQRARQAMAAVEELLVRQADRMILLFTPPFDKGKLEPGYIKGYVPGIRENGGQYTHGAAWVVQAAALLGQGNRAVELFNLLNPILHATSPEEVQRYRVEPYVMAGDVYSEAAHRGRGGWTWYTGSAGWMYRVAVETILGFRPQGRRLHLDPCVPDRWSSFELTYRYRSATYHITVENPQRVQRGVKSVALDGIVAEDGEIELVDDGKRHEVRVVLGAC